MDCAILPSTQLKALGFKITHSGPCPNPKWGNHWIHANKYDEVGVIKRTIYGYGEDEEAAAQDALKNLEITNKEN